MRVYTIDDRRLAYGRRTKPAPDGHETTEESSSQQASSSGLPGWPFLTVGRLEVRTQTCPLFAPLGLPSAQYAGSQK